MPSFARSTTILMAVLFVTATGLSRSVAQQSTPRCEGTLCDLYYRNSPPPATEPTQPAAPTPLTVPTGGFLGRVLGTGPTPAPPPGAAPAPAPFFKVQGGGILADKTDERCDGTACDIYYHGAPPPRATAPTVASAPGTDTLETTALAAQDAEPDADLRQGRRRGASPSAGVQFAKPACVAPPTDPWRCYR